MFLAAITLDFILLHILCLQVYAGLPDRRRHGPRSIYSYMEDLHKVIIKRATAGCYRSSQIHSVLRRTAEVISGVEHDDVAASGAD